MKPARRRKLTILIVALILIASAAGLILYALRQNISLFYSPTQIVMGEALPNKSIHVGGVVVVNSIIRDSRDPAIVFKLSDMVNAIDIEYRGTLPDLFREGQGVVVEGYLIDNKRIHAVRVLAKHDENYMPPEVAAALKNAASRIL